jgi:hypothetical protein
LIEKAKTAELRKTFGVRVKGQSKPTEVVSTFLLSDAEIPDRLN